MLINSDKFDISRLVIDNAQERDIKSIFYIYDGKLGFSLSQAE